MADLNFDKIIKKLQEIHKEFPSLRFGEIVQKAVDKKKMSANVDFHDLNSKQILSALDEYHIQVDQAIKIQKLKQKKKGDK